MNKKRNCIKIKSKACFPVLMEFIKVLLLAISVYCLAKGMQLVHYELVAILLFLPLLFLRSRYKEKLLCNRTKILLSCWSVFTSFILILGMHLHTEAAYSGRIDQSYIQPYSPMDVIRFFVMIPGIYMLLKVLYLGGQTLLLKHQITVHYHGYPINKKRVVWFSLFLFACWIPFLYTYYPGFIMSDSLLSLNQALGRMPFDNHHPVMYTLLIQKCIQLVKIVLGYDNITLGIALYTVVQMIFQAFGIGVMIAWLESRYSLKKEWGWFLLIVFGFSAYWGQLSIAMWKDSIFSTSLMLLTLTIFDLIKNPKEKRTEHWIALIVLYIIMIFSRNNGVYISIAMGVLLGISLLIKTTYIDKRRTKKVFGVTVGVILIAMIITGPIYAHIGIKKDIKEKYGIFLNQMARVVVYQGNLTAEDLEYMNELLPLEQYKEVYTPCCVDNVKWAPEFNSAPLENHFMKHYFKILAKNPIRCFEAWQLQTFGFWTINVPIINNATWNVAGGVVRNHNPKMTDATDLGVSFMSENKTLTRIFPMDSFNVPIGIINYLLFGTLVVVITKKRWDLFLGFGLGVGLASTLLLASPINYWARYGAAEQMMIPVFIIWILELLTMKSQQQRQINLDKESQE